MPGSKRGCAGLAKADGGRLGGGSGRRSSFDSIVFRATVLRATVEPKEHGWRPARRVASRRASPGRASAAGRDGLSGYDHDVGSPPKVAGPRSLESYGELTDDYDQWYPIWRSIEGRLLRFREPPGDPIWHAWMRFTATAIEDRAADALRQVFWLDLPGWNAATSAHSWPFRYLAPNLDLTVQFHRFAPEVDWILCDGAVPLAAEGIVGCVARLWTEDGRLLATGTSKHICRPNPGYEPELERAHELGLLP